MGEVIQDRAEIDRHLRVLRHLDNRFLVGPAREVLDFILDMHQITVEEGSEDYWRGPGIPLRNTLSLLDNERRRQRVSEISIDANHRNRLLR